MDLTHWHTRSNRALFAAPASSLLGPSRGLQSAVAVGSDPQLECELVSDFARLESISREWNGLWQSSRESEVFQNFNWLRAAWESSRDQLSLFTPVVYCGSKIVGILPLTLQDRTLQFLGSPLSDYNDVICADECATEVMSAAFNALLRARQHWNACVMDNVAAHSRLVLHLPQLQAPMRRNFRTAFRSPCSTILMAPGSDIAKKLARKENLRRHENALRRLGRVDFRHVEDREVIKQHLGTFFYQHMARRAVAGEFSHFLEERTRRMFELLVDELDPRTMLRFGVLTLDDRPVAYHFGFEVNGKFVFYQPTFDVDYWKSAPGTVLLRQLFLYAQESGLSEFDLTRGGEAYKDRYSTDIRENLTLHFNHDSGLPRRVQLSVQLADGALRKNLEKLRNYPRAYRRASDTAKGWLKRLRYESRLRCHEGARYRVEVIRRAFRNIVFDREGTTTFSMGRQEVKRHTGPLDAGFSIALVAFSELAVIASMHPRLIALLGDFLQRLIQGQQAYLIRQGSEPVQIWWTHESGPAESENSCPPKVLNLDQCWAAPQFPGGKLLRGILQHICVKEMDVLICCQERDPLVQEMHALGLQTCSRRIQLRVLHWFRPVIQFRRASSVSQAN